MKNVYEVLIEPKFFCELPALQVGFRDNAHAMVAKNTVDHGQH